MSRSRAVLFEIENPAYYIEITVEWEDWVRRKVQQYPLIHLYYDCSARETNLLAMPF